MRLLRRTNIHGHIINAEGHVFAVQCQRHETKLFHDKNHIEEAATLHTAKSSESTHVPGMYAAMHPYSTSHQEPGHQALTHPVPALPHRQREERTSPETPSSQHKPYGL